MFFKVQASSRFLELKREITLRTGSGRRDFSLVANIPFTRLATVCATNQLKTHLFTLLFQVSSVCTIKRMKAGHVLGATTYFNALKYFGLLFKTSSKALFFLEKCNFRRTSKSMLTFYDR